MRTIPTGRGGAQGIQGIQGVQGLTGPNAITANTVATYSQGAVPPTVFTTLIYKDTTAITGGSYVWNQSTQAYVKIT